MFLTSVTVMDEPVVTLTESGSKSNTTNPRFMPLIPSKTQPISLVNSRPVYSSILGFHSRR